MRYLDKFSMMILCFFLFQNCSTFEVEKELNVYSYTSQPDFFYDLKLISIELDSTSRELYVFDLAMTYAQNTDQDVTYQVAFSTLKFPGACNAVTGVATGVDKHVRFQCLLPTADSLFVQLTLLGPSGEEIVEQYKF